MLMREECLTAIFNNKEFNYTGKNESVNNIWKRYRDIDDIFRLWNLPLNSYCILQIG